MRALRDMNLPKFVFEDVPLFLGLISDLFPGLDCPRVRYPNFNDAVEQVLQDNGYVLLPHQVSDLKKNQLENIKDRLDEHKSDFDLWYSQFRTNICFNVSCCPFIFQVDKVVQMYETMLTRHTTMIVGPTGGGKSVVINTLAQAQSR